MAWPKSPQTRRPLWISLVFLVVCLIFGARLVNLQLATADGTYTFGERQILTEDVYKRQGIKVSAIRANLASGVRHASNSSHSPRNSDP